MASRPSSVTLAYTENDPATLIAPDGVVTDFNSSDFNGGSLTVSFGSSGFAEDQLSILTDGNILSRSQHSPVRRRRRRRQRARRRRYGERRRRWRHLVINFTTANATPAAVSTLIKHIAYLNNSEEPSTAARSVSFTVDDGR